MDKTENRRTNRPKHFLTRPYEGKTDET